MATIGSSRTIVEQTRSLADDVLFPGALDTDASALLPVSNLDALAALGLYGAVMPVQVGGLGLTQAQLLELIEILSSGCLTTAFVWMQHLGASNVVARTDRLIDDGTAAAVASGGLRLGVAFAHLRRPGPPVLSASRFAGGWLLNGTAPWVTGWERIHRVHTAALQLDDPQTIVWTLIDAEEGPTLRAERLELAAVNASSTVTLHFEDHVVADDRVTVVQTLQEWMARDAAGLRNNGSLSIGVAARCLTILGDAADGFADELRLRRANLDAATDGAEMAKARAEASAFALRTSAAVLAQAGGRGIVRDHQSQRLAREALFLLVQGQTSAIKSAQLEALTREPERSHTQGDSSDLRKRRRAGGDRTHDQGIMSPAL